MYQQQKLEKKLLTKKAKIIWFTGLSGTGKSTLSKAISKSLRNKYKIKCIDGYMVRKKNKFRNVFTKKNIYENNLEIIKYIKTLINKYDYIFVSVISPLLKTRKFSRKTFGDNYSEIYVYCSLATLIKRDTKGLYKKAQKNLIKNLIGYNSVIKYEKSNYKKIKINTEKNNLTNSIKILKKKLKIN